MARKLLKNPNELEILKTNSWNFSFLAGNGFTGFLRNVDKGWNLGMSSHVIF
tara:strand:+ start:138 stop:293 length:156 start_codon:yes stop_codon:yes gene_type:complete